MPDLAESTPATEPVSTETTPAAEPDSSVQSEQTPQAPQPDDVVARLARLEANLQGRSKEAEELRRERDQLRSMIYQYQTQAAAQPPAPKVTEPTDEQLAEMENQAFLDGDKRKLAEIRRIQREQAKREVMGEFTQTIQQLSTQAQKQQAFNGYLASRGIIDQSSSLFKDVRDRWENLAKDPQYGFLADRPEALGALAVEQVIAERKGATSGARETARNNAAEGAFTEGSKGKTTLPGKAAPAARDKMYFTPGEMKFIAYDVRTKGINEEEAKKKFWNSISEADRQKRIAEGRA